MFCGGDIAAVYGKQPARDWRKPILFLVRAIVPATNSKPRRETEDRNSTGPRRESHFARPRPSYPPAERAARHPSEKTSGKTYAKTPDNPAVTPTFYVAVLGDSLGQMMAQGLSEAFENRPEVAILRKAKENSGLVRDDFFDWTKATQDLLASGQKIDIRDHADWQQ